MWSKSCRWNDWRTSWASRARPFVRRARSAASFFSSSATFTSSTTSIALLSSSTKYSTKFGAIDFEESLALATTVPSTTLSEKHRQSMTLVDMR